MDLVGRRVVDSSYVDLVIRLEECRWHYHYVQTAGRDMRGPTGERSALHELSLNLVESLIDPFPNCVRTARELLHLGDGVVGYALPLKLAGSLLPVHLRRIISLRVVTNVIPRGKTVGNSTR